MTRSDRARVWYAIPSASVDRCRATLPAWRDMGYSVAVLQNRERGEIPADLAIWSDSYPGWAASINELCNNQELRNADIVVSGGDDMLPDPDHAAADIAALFFDRFPDGFGVMQPTGDGFMHDDEYCGSPWLGRAWIDDAYAGIGPMWPGYKHNWADHELCVVAGGLGALWMNPELTQRHDHFSRTGDSPPAYWTDTVRAADQRDVELFIGRRWQGFPGHEPRGDRRPLDLAALHESYPKTADRYWLARYTRDTSGSDDAMATMLNACKSRGLHRVAIYGAGTETRRAADALMAPGVEIVCLIDDDATLVGQSLWGYKIVSRDSAIGIPLDAIVLSCRGDATALRRRADPFATRGTVVFGLDDESRVLAREAKCG